MRRFLRRTADGVGQVALNPLSLQPELYLSAARGLGLDSVADGANVLPWPDQSGVSEFRTANIIPAGGAAPVMRRSGAHASANGGPAVQFDGCVSQLGCSTLTTNVSTANGFSILTYGRYLPAKTPGCNAFGCQIPWQSGGGASTVQTLVDSTVGWKDDLGFHTQPAPVYPFYGLLAWVFNPPNSGANVCNVYAVYPTLRVTGAWQWFNWQASGVSSYYIGSNTVGNCPQQMDLSALVVYSKALTFGQLAGIDAFFGGQFG